MPDTRCHETMLEYAKACEAEALALPACYAEQQQGYQDEAEKRLNFFFEAIRNGTAGHGLLGAKMEALWNCLNLPRRIEAMANENARLRTAMAEARDLLLEVKQGNPARSAGHNARLTIEAALR